MCPCLIIDTNGADCMQEGTSVSLSSPFLIFCRTTASNSLKSRLTWRVWGPGFCDRARASCKYGKFHSFCLLYPVSLLTSSCCPESFLSSMSSMNLLFPSFHSEVPCVLCLPGRCPGADYSEPSHAPGIMILFDSGGSVMKRQSRYVLPCGHALRPVLPEH